jgi:hypothetical protein
MEVDIGSRLAADLLCESTASLFPGFLALPHPRAFVMPDSQQPP